MSELPTVTLREVREKLQEITGDLAMIRSRLLELGARLPESSESWCPPGVQKDLDAAIELRAIIHCVVEDSVGPAIADLWGATEPEANRPARSDGEMETP